MKLGTATVAAAMALCLCCPRWAGAQEQPTEGAEEGSADRARELFMRGTDRRGLLSDVAKAITDTGTDISHADMRTTQGGMSGEFVVEVRDLAHLEKVRRAIGRVKGVLDVERREHFDEEDLGWA